MRAIRASIFFSISAGVAAWSMVASAAARSGAARMDLFGIAFIGHAQPALHFAIDVGGRGDGDAVGDAVLLGIAAGLDEAAFAFERAEGEAHIDAGLGGGLELS